MRLFMIEPTVISILGAGEKHDDRDKDRSCNPIVVEICGDCGRSMGRLDPSVEGMLLPESRSAIGVVGPLWR
jgi:hypothetical protein